MNDLEIKRYLKDMKILSSCDGIFCIDEFKTDLKTGHFIILNNLKKENFEKNGKNIPGHWTALLGGKRFDDPKSLVYFDPLGSLPQNLNFVKHLISCKKDIFYNNYSVQSLFSELCGLHVLYVVYQWMHGLSVDEILLWKYNIQSNYEFFNDNIVKTFIENIHHG